MVYNIGNVTKPDNKEIKNLNISYQKYVVWNPEKINESFNIIGFTGYSVNAPNPIIKILASGNPFSDISGTTAAIDFHIKPNNVVFEEFRAQLKPYEKYMVSERSDTDGFKFYIKDPTLLENGEIVYSNSSIIWYTTDKYNIDIDSTKYKQFLNVLLTIGNKYDTVKTDLITRFLTPQSLKTYDLTEENKMTKLSLAILYWREIFPSPKEDIFLRSIPL